MPSHADLVISMGVDHARLEREMSKAEREAVRSARDTQRQIERVETAAQQRRDARSQAFAQGLRRTGMLATVGIIAAARLAASAVDAYTNRFPELATGAGDAKRAIDDLWVSIGRDISGGLEDISGIIRQIGEARKAATNAASDSIRFVGDGGLGLGLDALGIKIADWLGVNTDAAKGRLAVRVVNNQGLNPSTNHFAVDAANAGAEAQAIDKRQRALADELTLQNELNQLRADGHAAAADALAEEAEQRRYNADIGQREKRHEITNDQGNALREGRQAVVDARRARRDRDTADFVQQQADHQQDIDRGVANQLEDDTLSTRIQSAHLRGMEEEAQLLERQFALRQRLRAVEQDRNLSEGQRRALIKSYTASAEELERIIQRLPAKRRDHMQEGSVLGAGLASNASLRQVVFGGGNPPELQEARQQTTVLGRIHEVLQRIERAGPRGGSVFS